MTWFVVYTLPQQEEVAARHLIRQGFDVYLPRYEKSVRHARKSSKVMRPLFPRYLFVSIDLDTQRWRSVNGTVGVKNIVSFGDKPAAVPEGVVEEIQARETENGAVRLEEVYPFKEGDRLEFVSGPFRDHVAVFLGKAPEQDKVHVLLSLLGRETRLAVSYNSVVSCA